MGELRSPLVRDDRGASICDFGAMETLTAQIPFIGWMFSPLGAAVCILLLCLVMSGILGDLVLRVETWVAQRAGSSGSVLQPESDRMGR